MVWAGMCLPAAINPSLKIYALLVFYCKAFLRIQISWINLLGPPYQMTYVEIQLATQSLVCLQQFSELTSE